jgi:hypothetical protein
MVLMTSFTSPGLLFTFLIVLFVLVYTVSVTNWTAPSGTQLRHQIGDCVIPIYTPKLRYEFKWMFETVTSGVTMTCGCTLIMKDPDDFVTDFTPWKEKEAIGPPFRTVLFVFMRSAHDHALWNDEFFRPYFLRHAVLFHTSDEFDDADVSYYPLFKRVYRNYYSSKADRHSSMSYLQGSGKLTDVESNIRWMPMGPSINFIYGPSLRLPLLKRPMLFFWAGSKSGKQSQGKHERADMLKSVQADPKTVALGKLHVFGYFQLNLASEDLMGPLEYTRFMYSAKLVPCPSGVSADQFRIYESLEAGAIPIVKEGHGHLRYMDLLRLRHVTVKSFNETESVLRRAASNAGYQQMLAAWQLHNNERWDEIQFLLAGDVAQAVCADS